VGRGVRLAALAATLLLAAGVALIVVAVLQRTTQFAIVVFVPVFFTTSWELPVGVFLVIAGAFATLVAVAPAGSEGLAGAAPAEDRSTGGLVLIGPIPIFFGSMTRLSRRARWTVTVLCVAVFVALLILLGLIV
jgi:uncharacterized protein (TIGR00304 family)